MTMSCDKDRVDRNGIPRAAISHSKYDRPLMIVLAVYAAVNLLAYCYFEIHAGNPPVDVAGGVSVLVLLNSSLLGTPIGLITILALQFGYRMVSDAFPLSWLAVLLGVCTLLAIAYADFWALRLVFAGC